ETSDSIEMAERREERMEEERIEEMMEIEKRKKMEVKMEEERREEEMAQVMERVEIREERVEMREEKREESSQSHHEEEASAYGFWRTEEGDNSAEKTLREGSATEEMSMRVKASTETSIQSSREVKGISREEEIQGIIKTTSSSTIHASLSALSQREAEKRMMESMNGEVIRGRKEETREVQLVGTTTLHLSVESREVSSLPETTEAAAYGFWSTEEGDNNAERTLREASETERETLRTSASREESIQSIREMRRDESGEGVVRVMKSPSASSLHASLLPSTSTETGYECRMEKSEGRLQAEKKREEMDEKMTVADLTQKRETTTVIHSEEKRMEE
ncbi:hypothetical protein PMAYCL1PPCAC_06617, partial [Pristionchus mayeri]